MRKLLVLAGALSCCGCSLLFMTGPPSNAATAPPEMPVECTTSLAAPIIDTIVAGFQVVRTGVALGADESDYTGAPISREADIGIGVSLSALFAVSAVYGYNTADNCDDAKRRHLKRLEERLTYPPGAWPHAPPPVQPGAPPPASPPASAPPPPVSAPPAAPPPPPAAAPAGAPPPVAPVDPPPQGTTDPSGSAPPPTPPPVQHAPF